MEDRYLFKAKRVDNGEWVKGYFVQTVESSYIVVPYKHSTICGEGSVIEIDKSTICQCTGLKDKNGNLIWENDVVKKFSSTEIAVGISRIVFGEYSLNLGWCAEGLRSLCKYDIRVFNVGFSHWDAAQCEIIGNIFDNPELLESEE